jgi:hypothetical protein
LSSKDGTVPIAVATTFDHTAGKPSPPTRTPRIVREVAVETTDTDPYRTMRRTEARRDEDRAGGMETVSGQFLWTTLSFARTLLSFQ